MTARKKSAAKKKAASTRMSTQPKAKKRNRSRTKVGTKIEKVFKGVTHRVTVGYDGSFSYRGKAYGSLTSIAKLISGYASVSGPRFFNLVKPKAKGK